MWAWSVFLAAVESLALWCSSPSRNVHNRREGEGHRERDRKVGVCQDEMWELEGRPAPATAKEKGVAHAAG